MVFFEVLKPILEKLPRFFWTLFFGYIILYTTRRVFGRGLKLIKIPAEIRGIFLSVVDILLWLILTVALANSLGLSKLALGITGSAAFLAAALANGAREFIGDLISGIYLARDKNFKLGSWVKIDDMEGEIISIDSRKVRLKDKNGIIYVIANSEVDKKGWAVLNAK
jgi:small-conductance mechanosensitive channel